VTPYIWLAILLPLLGAVANGVIAFKRPQAKGLVSLIGVGVLLGAFAVALAVFRESAAGAGEPVKVMLWQWMPVSDALSIDLALQVDRLSVVLLLVITGVGSLPPFSVGYMHDDPLRALTSRT
jgi:NADH-quinone oxidoreductase subunit L